MKYKYIENIKPTESQYAGYDLSETPIVDAVYRHRRRYAGNPYIEALPMPRSRKEIMATYCHGVDLPSANELDEMSDYEKFDSIRALKDFRVTLPFHLMLEYEFHRALCDSYSVRKRVLSRKRDIEITMEDEPVKTHCLLVAKDVSESNTGFTLLGLSGCGKSVGIRMMLAHYPQVIVHHDGDCSFVQITYLIVNCIPNSNFDALYQSIGRAIDRALGNMTPCYEAELSKRTSLGVKYTKVRDLVERFAIGMLILDEIQLINLNNTKENSIESLMTLNNDTNVAISVIGTEDAYFDLFKKRRTRRRMLPYIEASKYCSNYSQFKGILQHLFRYQWFNPPVKLTESLAKALYKASGGIIDQLVDLWMYVNIDYVKAKNKPAVDADFVLKTCVKHMGGVENAKTISEFEKKSRAGEVLGTINSSETENLYSEMESYYNENNKAAQIAYFKKKTIDAIKLVDSSYRTSSIESAFNSVYSKLSGDQIDENELISKILKLLEKRKLKREKKKRTTLNKDKLKSELLLNNEKVKNHDSNNCSPS